MIEIRRELSSPLEDAMRRDLIGGARALSRVPRPTAACFSREGWNLTQQMMFVREHGRAAAEAAARQAGTRIGRRPDNPFIELHPVIRSSSDGRRGFLAELPDDSARYRVAVRSEREVEDPATMTPPRFPATPALAWPAEPVPRKGWKSLPFRMAQPLGTPARRVRTTAARRAPGRRQTTLAEVPTFGEPPTHTILRAWA